jgi:cytochrome b561
VQQKARVTTAYPALIAWAHWLIALAVVGMLVLGLAFDSIPRAGRPWWINLHTIIGLGIFGIVLARILWRARNELPELPSGTGKLERMASFLMHRALYVLLIVIPISGIVAYVWHGRVFDFGWFTVNFGLASTKSIYEPAEGVHKVLVFTMIGLAALHALAALWHHFIKKDGLLWRMWPGRAPATDAIAQTPKTMTATMTTMKIKEPALLQQE